MGDWKINMIGNDGLEHVEMRGLEGSTTVTLYISIDDIPIVVDTARMGNDGSANP